MTTLVDLPEGDGFVLQQRGSGDANTHRRVDFVGYAGHQSTQGGHFFRFDQLALGSFEVFDRLRQLGTSLNQLGRAVTNLMHKIVE